LGSNLIKVQDLSGKIVGVQLGSIQEKNIKEIAKKVTGIQIKQLNRVPEAIQELKSKRIDAAIIENTVAQGFAGSNPDLEFNAIPSQENSGSAIAFAKNSPLVGPFNQVLQKMKDNGTLKELATKWFSKNTNLTNLALTEVKTGLNLDFRRIARDIPFIIRGIPLTLLFTVISVFLRLIWGTILS
jgi:polar amino acid transport system substrate-binding protein